MTLLFSTTLCTRSGKHRRCPQKYRTLIMSRLFGRKRTEPRRRGVLHISRDTLTRSSPLRLQFRLRKSEQVDLLRFEQADVKNSVFPQLLTHKNRASEMRCKEVAYANRLMYIAYMTVSTRKTDTAGRSTSQTQQSV